MKADGVHRSTDQDGLTHQSSGTGLKIVDGKKIQFSRFKDTPEQSPTTVEWPQESTRKLIQLQAVWDIFEKLLAVDKSVDLHSILQSLLMAWKQPRQSSMRSLTTRIRTAEGSYMIQMEVR